MRVLAIGDIHGCLRAFDALLDIVAPQPDDVLITLGDYVDRGPNSNGVIEKLIALKSTHGLIALRGNHEQMMLDARQDNVALESWLMFGGKETLESYATNQEGGSFDDIPERHWSFLEGDLVDFYETETHFFVHANAYPDQPLGEQPDYMLLYERFVNPPPHQNGKIMVCGHTSQKSGLPVNIGHAICIDTWAYGKGWLTCLDVVSGKYWQTNQQGGVRTGQINDLYSPPEVEPQE